MCCIDEFDYAFKEGRQKADLILIVDLCTFVDPRCSTQMTNREGSGQRYHSERKFYPEKK